MFGLGAWEIIVILALALIVLGPQKLPEVAKQLAKLMGDLRRVADDVRTNFEEAQREATPPNLAQLIAEAQRQDPTPPGQTPNPPPEAVAQLNASPVAAGTAPATQGSEAPPAPKPAFSGEFVPPRPADPAAFQATERAAHGHTPAAGPGASQVANEAGAAEEALSETVPSTRRPPSSGSHRG